MLVENILLNVFIENPRGGEDSQPVVYYDEPQRFGYLIVCDGLGGAGSRKIIYKDILQTQARLSASIVSDAVKHYFHQTKDFICHDVSSYIQGLKHAIDQELRRVQESSVRPNNARIMSDLLSPYPTTLASIIFQQDDSMGSDIHAIWAGDSRCYIMNESDGLMQLSRDDLLDYGDALINLSGDSRMSNFINAKFNYQLNHYHCKHYCPFILIVASDGCFDYVRAPFEFEHILLSTLFDSIDIDDWQKRLESKFDRIASDDVSLGLIAIGWGSFDEFKDSFKKQTHTVSENYIKPLEEQWEQIRSLRVETETILPEELAIRTDVNEKTLDLWNRYKKNYEKHLNIRGIQDINMNTGE